ncbi:MAG: hypothetical protein QW478_11830 [Candidatus Micrarchaeaceae archaeon]
METKLKITETEKNEEIIVHKVRFSLEGIHYVEVSNNGILGFLRYNDKLPPEFIQEVMTTDPDTGKDVRILPAPQIGQSKWDRLFDDDEKLEYVKFPGMPLPYDSPYKLYLKIKSFIHKFVEVEKTVEIMLPLWLMKAVVYDTLKELSFPSVHAIAPYGKGKSRLLIVMCEATPWGFYLIDVKSAALKRVTELYQPILYVDEKAHMDSDTAAIVNAKFNKTSVFLNADKEIQRGFGSLIGYKLFGPMVLAGRTAFNDDAIESKCLQVNQDFELERQDIPRKIKGRILDDFMSEGAEIRSMLLQFRIDYHDRINEIESSKFLSEYEKHLEPRLYETLSFFEDIVEIMPEVKSELREMLAAQIKRNVEVAKDTPNGIVASTLLAIIDSQENIIPYSTGGKSYLGIPLAAIYEEIGKDYAKQTGKILQALGLKTDRPRIEYKTKEVDDKGNPIIKKKQIKVVRMPDDKKLKELRSRYDVEYITSVLSAISEGRQTSEFNEFNEFNEKQTPPSNEKEGRLPENDVPHRPHLPQLPEDPEKSSIFPELKDDEISDDGFGFDYYRITRSFQYEFEKNGEMIKVACRQGQVRRLSNRTAIIYRPYLTKACPDGSVWDPISQQCVANISDLGGNNNE